MKKLMALLLLCASVLILLAMNVLFILYPPKAHAHEQFYEFVPPDYRPPESETYKMKECTGYAMLPPFECEQWGDTIVRKMPDCDDPRWGGCSFTVPLEMMVKPSTTRIMLEITPAGDYKFYGDKNMVLLEIRHSGEFFVKGKKAGSDAAVMQAFKDWLCNEAGYCARRKK